jgi:HEXXH motif-containing protein
VTDGLVMPAGDDVFARELSSALARRSQMELCALALSWQRREPAFSASLSRAIETIGALHGSDRVTLLSGPFFSRWAADLEPERAARALRTLAAMLLVPAARAGLTLPWSPLVVDDGEIRFPGQRFHLVLHGGERDAEARASEGGVHIRVSGAGELVVRQVAGEPTVEPRHMASVVSHPTSAALRFQIDDGDPMIRRQLEDSVLSDRRQVEHWRLRLERETDGRPAYLEDLERAAALLTALWPEAASEIADLVLLVVPLKRREDAGTFSSSFTADLMRCALFTTVEELPFIAAEMLVHESGHVKLEGLLRLAPAAVGNTGHRYWSAWKRMNRPLVGILHALYSYVRVAAYYQRALASSLELGVPPGQLTRRLAAMRDELRAGVAILENEPSFTPFGRALYDELARQCHHVGAT